MARNTPVPLRIIQGGAASIKDVVFPPGELIFDTTNKRLLVGDGLTLGGIPVAGDSAAIGDILTRLSAIETNALLKSGGTLSGDLTIWKNDSALFLKDPRSKMGETPSENLFPALRWLDQDGETVGFVQRAFRITGENEIGLAVLTKKADGSLANNALVLVTEADGTAYGKCPLARNLYNNDIAVMRNVMDYSPQRYTANIAAYVGGANASDTADLNNGRGLSEAKPFATPLAALKWAATHYAAAVVLNLVFCANMSLDGLAIPGNLFHYINMSGKTAATKLSLSAPISLSGGGLQLSNISLEGSNIEAFVRASGSYRACRVVIGAGVTMNGSVIEGTVFALNGAQVICTSAVSGTVTGKKYRLATNSFLGAPQYLPGSEDGLKDASSYA